jgi:hypothetical protein
MTPTFKQYNAILLAIFFLAIVPISLFCQPTGSPYTRYGIGDLVYSPNTRALGMGGAGIALPSNSTIDLYNPAAWTRINLTRFTISGSYNGLTTSDAANSSNYGNINFNDAMLAIPFSTSNGIVFAFGLSRYSTVGYTLQEDVSQSGFNYTLVRHGEGGISQAHIGLSMDLRSDLSIGAMFDYNFGTIQHNIEQQQTNSLYSNAAVERQVQLQGPGFTFGTIYTGFSNLLHLESSILSIGASVTTTSYLHTNQEVYVKSTVSTNIAADTTKNELPKLKLPYSVIAGIAYSAEHYSVASDIAIQNWNDPYAIGILIPMVRNTYRWSFGGEFTPKRVPNAPYFQRVSYRLGTFYNATYYTLNGQPLNEFGFTGGMNLPFIGDTRMNVAGEYGTRGTTDYGLQKEKFFRLTFSLTGAERWFLRPPED